MMLVCKGPLPWFKHFYQAAERFARHSGAPRSGERGIHALTAKQSGFRVRMPRTHPGMTGHNRRHLLLDTLWGSMRRTLAPVFTITKLSAAILTFVALLAVLALIAASPLRAATLDEAL